jgi:hypothetical protein
MKGALKVKTTLKASSPKDVHDNNQIPLSIFAAFIIFCDKKGLRRQSEKDDPDRREEGHAGVVA